MVQPKISVEDLLPRLNAHLNQINFKMFAKIVSDSNNFLWISIFSFAVTNLSVLSKH